MYRDYEEYMRNTLNYKINANQYNNLNTYFQGGYDNFQTRENNIKISNRIQLDRPPRKKM